MGHEGSGFRQGEGRFDVSSHPNANERLIFQKSTDAIVVIDIKLFSKYGNFTVYIYFILRFEDLF